MASEAIVARLKAVLSGDSSQLRADLGKAERSLKNFGDKATKTGRTLSTRVTLPMVGLGAAAVKTAADFESSMTKITALVGVAKDEVDTMSVAVRSMATQFGKSANEAADALFFITSAGLRGSTATDTLAASLKASAIGLGDTATIADLEDRITAIDYWLNHPEVRMSPEQAEVYWRERVRLMNSLLNLRRAQAQRMAF